MNVSTSAAAPAGPATPELFAAQRERLLNLAVSEAVLAEWNPRCITSMRQLAPAFGDVIYPVPGVQFTMRDLDGAESHQYRPDAPTGNGPKYVMPAGLPTAISVLPSMQPRVGKARQLHVIEGTVQEPAWASWAPLDALVVGMRGCYGFSHDGVVDPALYRLAEGVEKVVVVLDADARTNPKVWRAGKMLEKALQAKLGPKVPVVFVDLPAGGKAGADDYLASIPEADRAATVVNLIAAADKLGRKPAEPPRRAPRISGTPVSLYDDCVIRDAPRTDMDGKVIPGRALTAWGAKPVKITTLMDGLVLGEDLVQRGQSVDIAVSWMEGDERREAVVKGVGYPNGLKDVSAWMSRLPDGVGPVLWHDDSTDGRTKIVGAIKAAGFAEAVREIALTATGWSEDLGEDEALYVQGSGAIGEGGLNPAFRTELEPPFNLIRFDDPAAMSAEAKRADALASRGLMDMLVNPDPIVMFEGALVYVLSGAQPRTFPCFAGGKGSGKTTVMGTLLSAAGSEFYTMPMISASSTAKSIEEMAEPCNNFLGVIDDILKAPEGLASQRAFIADTAKLIVLSRRAYADGNQGGVRLKFTPNGLKSYTPERPMGSTVMLMVVAEELPGASDVGSTIDRILPVTMTHDSTWKPGQAREGRKLAASGSRARRTAAIIQWFAGRINAAGGLDAWVDFVEGERAKVEDDLKVRFPQLKTGRSRETVAPIIVGQAFLLEFCMSVGAVSPLEAKVALKDVYSRMGAIALNHFVSETGAVTAEEATLDVLRSAVASGKVIIGAGGDNRALSMGKLWTSPEGEHFIALIPAVANKVASRNVGKALSAISKKDKSGAPTYNVAGTRCVVIPIAAWGAVDAFWSGPGSTTAEICGLDEPVTDPVTVEAVTGVAA